MHPGQDVRLANTDLYAVIVLTSQGVAVYGEVIPTGSRRAVGYFFVAQDGGIAIGKQGATNAKYVFVKSQPSFSHSIAAPHKASGTLTMHIGDEVRVDGTALVLAAGHNPQGDASFAVVLIPHSSAIEGSYEAGISEHQVIVLRWHAGHATPVYTQAEPGPSTTPKKSTTSSSTRGGDIGKSVTLDGVRVKLVAVSNGASPRTVYDALNGQSAFDTATIEISNVSSSSYQSTSNLSTAIVATDGKTYGPDIDRAVANCTDFGSGGATATIDLPPGHSETGCVHFIVPKGVDVKIVAFSPQGTWTSGQYIVWKV